MLVDSASVLPTGWHPHDADQPWGADAGRAEATIDFVTADLPDAEGRFHYVEADLADPETPASLASLAVERFGALDLLVARHARSSSQSLRDVTVAELDASWRSMLEERFSWPKRSSSIEIRVDPVDD